jgi:hypothetical protein
LVWNGRREECSEECAGVLLALTGHSVFCAGVSERLGWVFGERLGLNFTTPNFQGNPDIRNSRLMNLLFAITASITIY